MNVLEKSLVRAAALASALMLGPGCATEQAATSNLSAMPDVKEFEVVSNAQLIADVLASSTPAFVKKIPLPAGARVAIVGLDRQWERGNPMESLYDYFAIALTSNLVTLVERDAEGLEASALEGWSDRLPFPVSSPCEGPCPVVLPPAPPVPATVGKGGNTQLVFQSCGGTTCGDKESKESCSTCRTPMVGMSADDALKIVDMMKKLDAAAAAAPPTVVPGVAQQPLASVPTSGRSYRDLFGHALLPTWFKRDGSKIVSEQAAATHVVAIRPLTVGTSIRPLESKKGQIQRKVRIDLVVRLIKTADGTVSWSDRLVYENIETFPASVRPRLEAEKFEFAALQYAPAEPAGTKPAEPAGPKPAAGIAGAAGALLGNLLGK